MLLAPQSMASAINFYSYIVISLIRYVICMLSLMSSFSKNSVLGLFCFLVKRFSSSIVYTYVSATVETRCRRHTVFGSVRLWVSEWVCASQNIVNTISQKNQWSEFHPIWIRDAFGFIDLLTRLGAKRSKVKVTAGGDIAVDGSPSSSIEFQKSSRT